MQKSIIVLIAMLMFNWTWAQSGSGNCLDFGSGSTAPITCTNSSLSSVTFPFTIMFWMKVDGGVNVYPIISTAHSTSGYRGIEVDYRPANDILSVNMGNNGGFDQFSRRTMQTIAPNLENKWVHVAVTMTSSTSGNIYVNGSARTVSYTGSGNNLSFPANGESKLGYWLATFDRNFEGQMDELSVWSRSLTNAQIRQRMCQKLSGTEPGLVGYYRFDNVSSVIADLSTNSSDFVIPAGNSAISQVTSEAPIGDTSVYSYSIGTASLTIPAGVTLSAINGTGAPDGVHVYYGSSHPDQDAGLGALCDTIGYFGRFIATNPNQPNIPGNITISPAMSAIYTRPKSNNGTWTTAPVTQPMFFSDIYREFIFDPGQFSTFSIDDAPYCATNSISAPFIFGGTYAWSTNQSGQTIPTPPPGQHWITVTTNCATFTDTFNIYVDTTVNALALDGDSAFYCTGDSLALAVFPYANRPPIDSVVWDDGTFGITKYVSQTGWLGAHVLVSGGCWNYDSIYIASKSESYSLGPDTTLCNGDGMTLQVPAAATNATWSTGATNVNSISLSSAGTYWVEFEFNSCTVTDTIVVTEKQFSVSLPADAVICEGETQTISFSANGTVDNILWSTGATTNSIDLTTAGSYWVQVTSGSCADADTFNLSVIEGLSTVADQYVTLCKNEDVLLSLHGVVPEEYIQGILWSTGSTGDSVLVDQQGLYIAEGLSPCGPYQVSFYVEEVQCDPLIYLPNAFSPNGDGLNDFFNLNIDGLREFKFLVIDRWGNVVFESYDASLGWSGEGCMEGVYGYKLMGITQRGEPYEHSGYITLIR